jgi:hypothetical protein
MTPLGILIIRSDLPTAVEADYLAWLSRGHTLKRVGIDGFCRRAYSVAVAATFTAT